MPRGLKKVDAAIDHWMKNVAPSPELRHLKQRQNEVNELRTSRHSSITLIFAAPNEEHNEAVVL